MLLRRRLHFVAGQHDDYLGGTALLQLLNPLLGLFEGLSIGHVIDDDRRVRISVVHPIEGHEVSFARDVDDVEADLLVVRLQINLCLAVFCCLGRGSLYWELAFGVLRDQRGLADVARAHHIHFKGIV